MKKFLKVLLVIVLILIALLAGVCWWQWDNIMAVKTSLSTSREDISGLMAENNQKIEDVAEKVEGVVVRDLTDEEKQALNSGEIGRQEILDRLTTQENETAEPFENAEQPSAEISSPVESAKTSAEGQEDPNRKLLSEYLAEIYLMKAEYTAWLEAKYDEVIAEYQALDKSERTTAAKYNIGMRCMKEALAKEKECDALMADMEKKILNLLTEMGEDTSLVDDIQEAYEKEKKLKKAYYLGLHS